MEDKILMMDDQQAEAAGDGASLIVLLERMVREQGQAGAAERLGVNYKTVAAALETRNLSRRMTHALELQLLSEENPVSQRHEDRITATDQRLDVLEIVVKELSSGIEQLRASLDTHRTEQDRVNRILERRLGVDSAVEAGSGSTLQEQEARQASKGRDAGTDHRGSGETHEADVPKKGLRRDRDRRTG